MGLADTLGGMQTAITLASDMAKLPNAPVEFIERDASGFSMMLMRLVRRAMAQSGMTDVLKLAAPAAQTLLPVERLKQTSSGEMPTYAHCLCSAQ